MIRNKQLLCIIGFAATLVLGAEARLPAEGIIGGEVANANQFPYLISLQKDGRTSHCGGGIIGDQFVLTAAHCVVDDYGQFLGVPMTVLAGTNDLARRSGAVTVRVAKIYVPTGFKPELGSIVNDIAVLKLQQPLGLRNHQGQLKQLQLPRDPRNSYVGATVKITGFGWDWVRVHVDDIEEGGNSDTRLRFAEADVIRNAQCQLNYSFRISEKQICARTKQRFIYRPSGVCAGDSGGPLVLDGETVVGVVSSSPVGCTEKVSAAMYTRVSSFINFIDKAMHDIQSYDIRTLELIPESSNNYRPYWGYTTTTRYPYYYYNNRG